jgi:signal transduction histidine kinase
MSRPTDGRSTLKSSSWLLHLKLIYAYLTTLGDAPSRWKQKHSNPSLAQIVKAELELTEDLYCSNTDSAQTQHVIMNLAVNAKDAMPHGGTLVI